MTEPTLYEVLSLPQTVLDEAKDDQIPIIVKQAYHRALLRHHPDKAPVKPTTSYSSPSTNTAKTYTIDQITTAYSTLSRPTLRAAYNIHLRTLPAATAINSTSTPSTFQTGIETLDLDDLASDESTDGTTTSTTTTTWFKPCRCGNERGFVFGEADLEEAGDLGELIVGCQDCSLWLRVCFAVVEEEEEAEAEAEEAGKGLPDEVESRAQSVPRSG
ncbi:unnamed protein product [Discula destructiva]